MDAEVAMQITNTVLNSLQVMFLAWLSVHYRNGRS